MVKPGDASDTTVVQYLDHYMKVYDPPAKGAKVTGKSSTNTSA